MVCLNIPYNLKHFKACLSQILLGPFLHLHISIDEQSSEAYLGPYDETFCKSIYKSLTTFVKSSNITLLKPPPFWSPCRKMLDFTVTLNNVAAYRQCINLHCLCYRKHGIICISWKTAIQYPRALYSTLHAHSVISMVTSFGKYNLWVNLSYALHKFQNNLIYKTVTERLKVVQHK